MQVSVQRLPKSAIKLTISIPVDKVKEAQEKALTQVVAEAEIDGFRKGRAPVELVKQKLNHQKFDAQVIGDLVKTYYPKAVDQEKLAPIISPKIEIDGYEPDKDFTFTAETALRPEITVGDYKKAVKDSYEAKTAEWEKSRKEDGADIQTQEVGEAVKKDDEKRDSQQPQNPVNQSKGRNANGHEHDHVHMTPTDIVDAILTVTQVDIPDMVVAEEVDRMLTRLVQQLQPLNLAMESYLKSVNKTGDQLRAEYAEIAKKNVASEMALVEIVKKEHIEVADKEIEATVTAMGDDKLKQRYMDSPVEKAYVKAIIAKNKLIWKLISEVEGTAEHQETQKEGSNPVASTTEGENKEGAKA